MKKIIRPVVIIAVLFSILSPLTAQRIMTAEQFFQDVSQTYAQIEDYEAQVRITQGEKQMEGTLYYKNPNFLRIDFSRPEEQVLSSNGEVLFLYIPQHDVVMTQELDAVGAAPTQDGLKLLSERYSVAYVEGPDPIPLNQAEEPELETEENEQEPSDPDEDQEMVVKLRFNWQLPDEGFRQIDISVTEEGLIRRMVGVTKEYDEITFDFLDVKLNQNIPFGRFYYDAPSSAYQVKNFLFGKE